MIRYIESNECRKQQPVEAFSEDDIYCQLVDLSSLLSEYGCTEKRPDEKIMCQKPFLKALENKEGNKCKYCIAASFEGNLCSHPCVNETKKYYDSIRAVHQKKLVAFCEMQREYRTLELTVLRDYWEEILKERMAKNGKTA